MTRILFFIASVLFISIYLTFDSYPFALAQVMQSTSYQIQSDSINFGGGLATSTNYALESTVGEVGTGAVSSASYNIKAGYQQMQETFISITGASAVSMSPSIPGITGGTSNGSTTVTVTTDSPSGYQLTIAAENSPALQKGVDSIADYVPGGDPDFTFTTGASDAHFGYSPEGVDIVQRFLDDGDDGGSSCNDPSGTDTPLTCWDGLDTTEEVIATDSSPNHPDGSTTTVYFRVGIGSAVGQPLGFYRATTTVTALSL